MRIEAEEIEYPMIESLVNRGKDVESRARYTSSIGNRRCYCIVSNLTDPSYAVYASILPSHLFYGTQI